MRRPVRPPPLGGIDALVERRIEQAMREGQFNDLPGSGAPLPEDDAALVPAELRMAYRILKNAGYVPPEVERLREIAELERAVLAAEDDVERRRALVRINALLDRSRATGRPGSLQVEERYFEQVVDRLSRRNR